MEEWSCRARGFSAEELQFVERVLQAPQGWLSMRKRVHLGDNREHHKVTGRLHSFVLQKTAASEMARKFPQQHLRGLSVTDRGASPAVVYIHAANWNRIPQGSDFRSLDDYRAALINHELAHVFGYAHVHCAMPGMPADVRQQPSKPLRGCVPTTDVLLYNSAPEHYD
jgi:hypothetical protein